MITEMKKPAPGGQASDLAGATSLKKTTPTRRDRKFDCDVKYTRNGHLRLTHCSLPPLIKPSSPSCWRSERKLPAVLRSDHRNLQS